MSETFDEIIRAWRLKYNDRIPSDSYSRREALIVLLGNLDLHGFKKQDLIVSKKTKIIRACLNPNYKDKKRLLRWQESILDDLAAALQIYYKLVEIKMDVVTPEMTEKLVELKKLEETKKTHDNNKKDVSNEETDDESQIRNCNNLDITEEMMDSIEGPAIIYDNDFLKKLEEI